MNFGRLSTSLVAVTLLSTVAEAEVHFGAIGLEPDTTGCLATVRWTLEAGDTVVVAQPDGRVPAVFAAIVESKLPGACSDREGVWGDSVSSYRVRVLPPPGYEQGLGVAVPSHGVSGYVCSALVHLRMDGADYLVRSCASDEGVHLTVWRDCERVWHEYFYLRYGADRDCTDEEVGTR